jgi:hypothetical protein
MNAVFWEVTPCCLVERYVPFGGTNCLYLLPFSPHAIFNGVCQKHQHEFRFLNSTIYGARSSTVVEALRYKLEGRGIDSQWYQWNFSLT